MDKKKRIEELNTIINTALEKCANEPEKDGDRGACLEYHGYYSASKELNELIKNNDGEDDSHNEFSHHQTDHLNNDGEDDGN